MITRIAGIVCLVFGALLLLIGSQEQGATQVGGYLAGGVFVALGLWRFVASFRRH